LRRVGIRKILRIVGCVAAEESANAGRSSQKEQAVA
jgi:hypothetical protein